MSTVPLSPAAEYNATRRWNYLGAGLIFVAFIGPSLATMAGLGNAFSVGEDIARTLGSLAFLALIAWLVVRKKSDLSKAKARAVVGLLLCITVGNNVATAAREKEQAKSFLRQAMTFQAKHTEKFVDLGRRFDEVTVAQYLTPEGLTSAASVAAGKAALERYRSLLQERNLLLQTYLAEYVAFVGSLPAGQVRAGAESTLGPNKEATEQLYKMLDRVQRDHAAAMGALFDWAAANSGKIEMRKGQLMFTSVSQQQELQSLANKLQAAEDEVAAASKKAQAAQAAAMEKNNRLQKEAAELLAK
jgi:hypothetical protein